MEYLIFWITLSMFVAVYAAVEAILIRINRRRNIKRRLREIK